MGDRYRCASVMLLFIAIACSLSVQVETKDAPLCPNTGCMCKANGSDFIVNCTARSLHSVPKELPWNATVLLLSYNKIQEIPENTFRSYSKLETLDLSYNEGIKIYNNSLQGLTNLQRLILRQEKNSVQLSCDRSFHDLTKLKVLDMRSTNFSILGLDMIHRNFSDQMAQCFNVIIHDLKQLEHLAIRWNSSELASGFSNISNLKILDLSHSAINITRSVFTVLSNLPLERLSLRSMPAGIQLGISFEPLALSELKYLQVVDISCHDNTVDMNQQNSLFTWTDILESFENSSIHTLIMDGVLGTTVPPFSDPLFWEALAERTTPTTLYDDLFKPMTYVQLKQLSIQWNGISVVEPFLTHLSKLEYINLDYNFVNFVPNAVGLLVQLWKSCIKEFHLSHQFRKSYDCNKENPLFWTKILPTIQTCQKNRNTIPYPEVDVIIPPAFEQLYINNYPDLGHQLSYRSETIYHAISKNNLKMFDFSSSGVRHLHFAFIGLQYLKEVKLDNNLLESVHPQFFKYLPSLETLWLSKNRFGLFTGNTQKLTEIFSDLTNLKFLDLADNFLETLPENMFENCSSLEILNLSGNAISQLNFNFSKLPKLKELDLGRNPLSGLANKEIIQLEEIAKDHELRIKLDENKKFKCTCDYIDFVKWIQNSTGTRKTNITSNISNLTCTSLDGEPRVLSTVEIDGLNGLYIECIRNHIITATLTCALAIVVLCVTVWYHRWTIKYWYYRYKIARKARDNNNDLQLQDLAFAHFDVYISYPEADLEWAEQIRKKLEREMMLHAFFPDRDFVPGENIGEETVRGIDASKKLLLCINENYNDNQYQNFTLHMSCVRGKGFIIPIIKGEIPMNKLPRVLRRLLRDDMFLNWPTEARHEENFWENLKKAIKTRKGVYFEKNGRVIYYA